MAQSIPTATTGHGLATEKEIVELKDNNIKLEIPIDLSNCLQSTEYFDSICRFCLSTNNDENNMISIWNNRDSISQMFSSLTSIYVTPDDGLPSKICAPCKLLVIQCYEFKINCLKTDSYLKYFLRNGIVPKQEAYECNVSALKAEPNENNAKSTEIKHESECLNDEQLNNDAEYLENVSDTASDSYCLSLVKNITNTKKKGSLQISVTDADSLLNEVITNQRTIRNAKKPSYECPSCSKKFVEVKTLKAHIEHEHNPPKNLLPCNLCKESFASEHDLQLHSALHFEGNLWKCNQCGKEFKEKTLLRRHIFRHMEKRFSCDVCDKEFVEMYALRRHERVHTGEILEKKYGCHICSKRYVSNSTLAVHMTRHTGVRPCVCDTCGKTFPTVRLLNSHRRVHSDTKQYKCQFCDKQFRHESTRNTHHRTHTGEKPYVCAICGKTFIQNSNLTLHMRTHTGERPYKCGTCGRQFSSGSSLKHHQVVHTGEKPYSCTICGMRSARMDMREHMKVHTGERPFQCSVCNKKFSTAGSLRIHFRMHTGEKPFECALCSMKCTTKSHLAKHIKIHERKKSDPRIKKILADKREAKARLNKHITVTRPNLNGVDNVPVDVPEVPIAVTEEVLEHNNEMETGIILVGNGNQHSICLSNGVNLVSSDLNTIGDVNLVTVNEGEVNISSSAMLEGATVKLYQVDQSLLQIHSVGGQVTISKITSKMTANF